MFDFCGWEGHDFSRADIGLHDAASAAEVRFVPEILPD